jgi:hypothetical protein
MHTAEIARDNADTALTHPRLSRRENHDRGKAMSRPKMKMGK